MPDTIIYLLVTIALALTAIGCFYSGRSYLEAKALEAIAYAEIYARKAASKLTGDERRMVAVAAYARLPKAIRLVVSQEQFATLVERLFSTLAGRVNS
jgi:hypothetical protein